ncbi:MAG TPA: glycosyltransferase family 39 protein, partial [Tepidisphaeraceae bacterium]|nr:glycosyltransferase family 39 protein [Tepidisphaeraceae bacterium]
MSRRPDPPPPPPVEGWLARLRRWALVALLVGGFALWITVGLAIYEPVAPLLAALAAAAVAVVPRVRMAWAAAVVRVRPAPASMGPVMAFVAAVAYLAVVTFARGRDLRPAVMDEYGYLISGRIIATGRLWMPPHPVGAAFESSQILTDGLYASAYFPGTGLMLAPALRAGAPAWVVPLLAAGGVAALLYAIMRALFGGAAGAVAVVLAVATPMFRTLAFSILSQMPVLLLGLGLTACWMRWHRVPAARWAVAMGACAGWAAITRPVDALCFALPVGAAVLWDLRRAGWHRGGVTVLSGVLGLVPFAAIQLTFNRGVTGSPWTAPFTLNAHRDYPGTTFGFHDYDPAVRPATTLPQKIALYDAWVVPMIRQHRPDTVLEVWANYRLPVTLLNVLPHAAIVVLLPAGLLAARTWPRAVAVAVLPAFVGLYAFYAFFLFHYPVTALPAVIALVLGATRAVRDAVPVRGPSAGAAATAFVLVLAGGVV